MQVGPVEIFESPKTRFHFLKLIGRGANELKARWAGSQVLPFYARSLRHQIHLYLAWRVPCSKGKSKPTEMHLHA
jgi:hypothetical protein